MAGGKLEILLEMMRWFVDEVPNQIYEQIKEYEKTSLTPGLQMMMLPGFEAGHFYHKRIQTV